MRKVFIEQLRREDTVWTVLIVGTLINIYGQVLVPVARGSSGIFTEFRRNFEQAPLVALSTVVLGYLFPLLVSSLTGARTRIEIRTVASLAQFPELKPDPVFRADDSGAVIEAGARTRVLFERHHVRTAQDILGEDAWGRIVSEVGREGVLTTPEAIYFAPAGRWYAAAASAAPEGINVYLAAIPSPAGEAA